MSEHIFRTEQQEDGMAVYIEKDTGIVSAKPAQLGEIVRCRDCEYSMKPEEDGVSGLRCRCHKSEYKLDHKGDPSVVFAIVPPDGFCAWGERAS